MVVLLPWYTMLSCNYGEFAPRYTMLSCNYGDSELQNTMLSMKGLYDELCAEALVSTEKGQPMGV
jgi:hypothetical protein